MIWIRADANESISSGHIMRCLAIADAIRDLGHTVSFLLADTSAVEMVESHHFPYVCLHSNWLHLQDELPKLITLLRLEKDSTILVDSYQATPAYLELLRNYSKVAYLDDLDTFQYPVDLLINYSYGVDKVYYQKKYSQQHTQLLLGCRYTPLRKEFADRKRDNIALIKNVMLTTGGSDPYNISGALLRRLINTEIFKPLTFHVIAGPWNTNTEELLLISNLHPNIVIHYNVTNMAELMMQCDLAISAGGTTLAELCACGLPVICCGFADNQLQSQKFMALDGVIESVGDIRTGFESRIMEIVERLCYLYQNSSVVNTYAQKAQQTFDGKGARRIAEELIKL
jgi:UDP-2,4-diacetamido-2,4,6-trideoxy-beta-L-altropyranose hydrolase